MFDSSSKNKSKFKSTMLYTCLKKYNFILPCSSSAMRSLKMFIKVNINLLWNCFTVKY